MRCAAPAIVGTLLALHAAGAVAQSMPSTQMMVLLKGGVASDEDWCRLSNKERSARVWVEIKAERERDKEAKAAIEEKRHAVYERISEEQRAQCRAGDKQCRARVYLAHRPEIDAATAERDVEATRHKKTLDEITKKGNEANRKCREAQRQGPSTGKQPNKGQPEVPSLDPRGPLQGGVEGTQPPPNPPRRPPQPRTPVPQPPRSPTPAPPVPPGDGPSEGNQPAPAPNPTPSQGDGPTTAPVPCVVSVAFEPLLAGVGPARQLHGVVILSSPGFQPVAHEGNPSGRNPNWGTLVARTRNLLVSPLKPGALVERAGQTTASCAQLEPIIAALEAKLNASKLPYFPAPELNVNAVNSNSFAHWLVTKLGLKPPAVDALTGSVPGYNGAIQ